MCIKLLNGGLVERLEGFGSQFLAGVTKGAFVDYMPFKQAANDLLKKAV